MDQPWQGDACSLVDEFRVGKHNPLEELEATLAAVDASELNAVCHIDEEAARRFAKDVDVQAPFGGVPLAVKELLAVKGWPGTEASVALADRLHTNDAIAVTRLRAAGAVVALQTTSSEFGGVNQTTTKLHGVTRNPWDLSKTPGGSSGGSAAGVAGGLFTIATASDGGGSIRIPAGFCGLIGLKTTYGRVPKGPREMLGNLTSVELCVSRSVRDTARWLDIANGHDARDPFSLPRVVGYEDGLGSSDITGLRCGIVTNFGGASVSSEVTELVEEAATALISAASMARTEVVTKVPPMTGPWGLTGSVGLRYSLGDRWPECAGDLTGMMRSGVEAGERLLNLDALVSAESRRVDTNAAMAAMFEEADLVVAPTNPHTAFEAEGRLPSVFGDKESKPGNNGALTIPSNIYGNPSISLPIGLSAEGLPVAMQVMAPHHREDVLLDVALLWERTCPWPLIAPIP
ncbi:MAG: amidase [Acidobacteria bacterium]|nr:amidase [Acidobacteriota bacterium]